MILLNLASLFLKRMNVITLKGNHVFKNCQINLIVHYIYFFPQPVIFICICVTQSFSNTTTRCNSTPINCHTSIYAIRTSNQKETCFHLLFIKINVTPNICIRLHL